MSVNIKTPMSYGEFVDAMREVANRYPEPQVHFETWEALADDAQWAEFRPMPLEEGHVLNFAQDMADYIRERLAGICSDRLYEMVHHEGHAFLQALHAKLAELDIEVELSAIDVPLTPTDALIASGAAQVVSE